VEIFFVFNWEEKGGIGVGLLIGIYFERRSERTKLVEGEIPPAKEKKVKKKKQRKMIWDALPFLGLEAALTTIAGLLLWLFTNWTGMWRGSFSMAAVAMWFLITLAIIGGYLQVRQKRNMINEQKIYFAYFEWMSLGGRRPKSKMKEKVQILGTGLARKEYWDSLHESNKHHPADLLTLHRDLRSIQIESEDDLGILIYLLLLIRRSKGKIYPLHISEQRQRYLNQLMVRFLKNEVSLDEITDQSTENLLELMGLDKITWVRLSVRNILHKAFERHHQLMHDRFLKPPVKKKSDPTSMKTGWRKILTVGLVIFKSDFVRLFLSTTFWTVVGILLGGAPFVVLFYLIIRRFLRPIYEGTVLNWERALKSRGGKLAMDPMEFGGVRIHRNSSWDDIRRAYYDLESLKFDEELKAPWERLLVYEEVLRGDMSKHNVLALVRDLQQELTSGPDAQPWNIITQRLVYHNLPRTHPGVRLLFEILEISTQRTRPKTDRTAMRQSVDILVMTLYACGFLGIGLLRVIILGLNLVAMDRRLHGVSNTWRVWFGYPEKPYKLDKTASRSSTQTRPAETLDKNEILKDDLIKELRSLNLDDDVVTPFIEALESKVTVQSARFVDRSWMSLPLRFMTKSHQMPRGEVQLDLQNNNLVLMENAPMLVNLLGALKLIPCLYQHEVAQLEKEYIHLPDPEIRAKHNAILRAILRKHWDGTVRLTQKRLLGPKKEIKTPVGRRPASDASTDLMMLAIMARHAYTGRIYSLQRKPGVLYSKRHNPFFSSYVKTREHLTLALFHGINWFLPGFIAKTNQSPYSGTELKSRNWRETLTTVGIHLFFANANAAVFVAIFGGIFINMDLSYLNDVALFIKNLLSKIPLFGIGEAIEWLWDRAVVLYEFLSDKLQGPIEALKNFFDWILNKMEPVRYVTKEYLLPFVYIFLVPAFFFVWGVFYGYLIFRLRFGRFLWLNAYKLNVKVFTFIMTTPVKAYYDILDEPMNYKLIQRIEEWVEKIFKKSKYLWSLPYLFLYFSLHVIGLLAYLGILGTLSFPHLDLQTLIMYFQGLGIPITPMMLVVMTAFVIGFPLSWFFWYFEKFVLLFRSRWVPNRIRIKEFRVIRRAFGGWLAALFMLLVLTPVATNLTFRHNPFHWNRIQRINQSVAVYIWEGLANEMSAENLKSIHEGMEQERKRQPADPGVGERAPDIPGVDVEAEARELEKRMENEMEGFDWTRIRNYFYGTEYKGLEGLVHPNTGLPDYAAFIRESPDLFESEQLADNRFVSNRLIQLWLSAKKGQINKEIEEQNPLLYKNAAFFANILRNLNVQKNIFIETFTPEEFDPLMNSIFQVLEDPSEEGRFSHRYRQQFRAIDTIHMVLETLQEMGDTERLNLYRQRLLNMTDPDIFGDNQEVLKNIQDKWQEDQNKTENPLSLKGSLNEKTRLRQWILGVHDQTPVQSLGIENADRPVHWPPDPERDPRRNDLDQRFKWRERHQILRQA